MDWAFQQSWGPSAGISGLEQTQRMLDKLREFGLAERSPK
jgi:hypothetical protein